MPGVYISYPFCGQKCSYCNFASDVLPASLERDYRDALLAEIREHVWGWSPETVYLGGGSPSRMDPSTLDSILGAIPGRPWTEATLEAVPSEVTADRARQWSNFGITRASLGVQSFVDSEIRRTGRTHTAAMVEAATTELRRAGVSRLNIDLIAGLPGQTGDTWEASLDWVGRLGIGHVSVYMLEVDEDSRLGRELLRGGRRYGALDVPSEGAIAGFYERAVERLGSLGLHRYEISNFARRGEASLHNLKYWRLEPYAGFGADAHSFDGRARRRNAETAGEYVARWREQQPVYIEETAAHLTEERFFVGLRLSEGMVPSPAEWQQYGPAIARFVDQGLLECTADRLRLTGRGILVSNEVFQEFIAV